MLALICYAVYLICSWWVTPPLLPAQKSYYTVTYSARPEHARYVSCAEEAVLLKAVLRLRGLWHPADGRVLSCQCEVGFVPAESLILLSKMNLQELASLGWQSKLTRAENVNMRHPFDD